MGHAPDLLGRQVDTQVFKLFGTLNAALLKADEGTIPCTSAIREALIGQFVNYDPSSSTPESELELQVADIVRHT